MFRFRTDHTNQERRDGFVSFRCFLWLGGGGEEDEEDGNVNRGGWERTWRGWERTLRGGKRNQRGRKRDFEVGGKRDSERE